MTIRRATIRRVEKEIENAGVPPQEKKKDPPNEQAPESQQGSKVPIEERAMSIGEIRI